jgi:hypothetical protein
MPADPEKAKARMRRYWRKKRDSDPDFLARERERIRKFNAQFKKPVRVKDNPNVK